MIRAITRNLGGSALARRALAGELPDWFASQPRDAASWKAVADEVAQDFAGRSWLDELLPALQPSHLAADRLRAAAQPGGIVVTGGQQPGLFGGPLYVLNKAITLLEMADALASATGRAVAPIFWAATDDADFVEANHVSVVRRAALDRLEMADREAVARSMANTPLGDVTQQLARLEEACGSTPDGIALEAVRDAYTAGSTVGSAYVTLLRSLLEPLGVAVLDASHDAIRTASHATVVSALMHSEAISEALKDRSRDIVALGFHPQVADVPNLSLVFETAPDGTRKRVPVRNARNVASEATAAQLGPNVLLRPIVERRILPTVTYVGGPGEVAYFAQVSAVAEAMGTATPRISPRWSGTLVEPQVRDILEQLGATIEDFADPHAMEGKVAREGVSAAVRDSISRLRAELDLCVVRMRDDEQTSEALARSIGTMQAGVEHRLQRLERRYAAARKQAGSQELRDVALVRASLYPAGAPQERVLSFIPFLARYGSAVIDAARAEAKLHVARVINGG
jgi:bacillithiol biosynthesis cysteine-adding enzyme BshC